MNLNRFSIGTLGLLAVSGLAWSCSAKSDDCNANLNCAPYGGGAAGTSGASSSGGKSGASGASSASGNSGVGGTSGEGGIEQVAGTGGAPTPACDGSLSPDLDPCVIADGYGLFVSPDGDDPSADGTQAHPFATLTAALASITKIKRVYLCAADYEEPATIEIPDRVSIYGGFTCNGETWKYDSPLPAHLLPKSPIGATIADAKVGVLIQDLRIDALNAEDGAGASSFGLMINSSQGVALKRVEIRAGKGGKGKAGTDGAPIPDAIPSGEAQKGKAAECGTSTMLLDGASAVGVQCTSQGGKGGDGTKGTQNQMSADRDGKSGFPGASNGTVASQSANASGGDGKEGMAGIPGMLGSAAPSAGAFTDGGYVVASGGDGSSGQPGQGGGGGASSFAGPACVGASGGAGGMGGCGGTPGTGGGGGGASVALFSWNSSVSLDTCVLVAREGGAGGNAGKGREGGAGEDGGKGGAGNATNQVGVGGKGGAGGNGGNGGSGAGGTGGSSVALVWNGTMPVEKNTPVFQFAQKPAPGGLGGQLGLDPNNKAPDGSTGATQGIHPKP
ncbi:MAG TPA: hypothetical protein VJV79_25020 [Polyangiaceae bacterium]|nr:hypothetical protein [Polyangiaceae bacterium]